MQKEMADRLARECGGMLASTTRLAKALGYDRGYVADKLKDGEAKVFGTGKQIRYSVDEVAEIFCKGVL